MNPTNDHDTLLLDYPTLTTLLDGFFRRIPNSSRHLSACARDPAHPTHQEAQILLTVHDIHLFPTSDLIQRHADLRRLTFEQAEALAALIIAAHDEKRQDWLCLITSRLLDYLDNTAPFPANASTLIAGDNRAAEFMETSTGQNVAEFLATQPDFHLEQTPEGDFTLQADIDVAPDPIYFDLQDKHGKLLPKAEHGRRRKQPIGTHPEALRLLRENCTTRRRRRLVVHWAASALHRLLANRHEDTPDYHIYQVFDDPWRRALEQLAADTIPDSVPALLKLARKTGDPLGMHLRPLLNLKNPERLFPLDDYLAALPAARPDGSPPRGLTNLQHEALLVLKQHLRTQHQANWLLAIDSTLAHTAAQAADTPLPEDRSSLLTSALPHESPRNIRLIHQGPDFRLTRDPDGRPALATAKLHPNPENGLWPFIPAVPNDTAKTFTYTIVWDTPPHLPS